LASVNWGYRNSATEVTVRSLLLRFDASAEQDLVAVGKDATVFADRLVQWLCAESLDLADHYFDLDGITWGPPEWEQRSMDAAYRSGRLTDPVQARDPRSWHHAIDHAAHGDEAPMPGRLYVEAMEKLLAGDHRSAVIDAGTVAEAILVIQLKRLLDQQGCSTTVIDMITGPATLGTLVERAKKLALPLPADTTSALVQPRNRAVHGGVAPPEELARKAFAVTGELIERSRAVGDLDCTRWSDLCRLSLGH
jgi:hypothetical protein